MLMGKTESSAPGVRTLLIHGVTVISPERPAPLTDASVLVRDGRITWVGQGRPRDVPADAERLDGRGRYLVPGFIDAHVHVGHASLFADAHHESHPDLVAAYHAQVPRSYLFHGFTTLIDPDLGERTAARFARHAVAPALVGCGRGLRYFDGYGPALFPDSVRDAVFPVWMHDSTQTSRLPAGVDPAAHTPEHLVPLAVAAGARCIKTYHESGFGGVFDWPVPSTALLERTVRAAGMHGVPVLLHATGLDGYRAGIGAGVNVLAHGLWHWPGSRLDSVPPAEVEDIVRAVARAGIAVQPTLRVLYGELETWRWGAIDDPRLADALPPAVLDWLRTDEGRWAQRELHDLYAGLLPDTVTPAEQYMSVMNARVRATVRSMLRAGVPFLFGSDTPAGDGLGNLPGLNGALEIAAWWDAGIPPLEILRALTLHAAERFGLADTIGSIEAGKRADLLLLSQDPLATVDAYSTIEIVIRDGVAHPRTSFSAREARSKAIP